MAVWAGNHKVRMVFLRPNKDAPQDEEDDDLMEDSGRPSGTKSVVKGQGANLRLGGKDDTREMSPQGSSKS